MKVNRAAVVLVLGLTVFSVLYLGTQWRVNSAKNGIRSAIVGALQTYKNCQGDSVDLAAVLPERFTEVCLQPAYLSRQDFQTRTGKIANGYEVLLYDGAVTWWLVEKNGHEISVDMSNAPMVLSPVLIGRMCYSRGKSAVSFQCRSTQMLYRIEDK